MMKSAPSREAVSIAARYAKTFSECFIKLMNKEVAAQVGSEIRPQLVEVCLLRAQFGKGEPAAPASPSRGPGNGILRAETGGLFQAQNAGEQSEFGSQTTLRLTNPPELRGFLSTRKPPRFVGTGWWGM